TECAEQRSDILRGGTGRIHSPHLTSRKGDYDSIRKALEILNSAVGGPREQDMKRTRKGTTRPSRRRWRSFGFLLHQTLQNSVPYGMYRKSMQLYSAKADAEVAGDDFVRLAGAHQLKDLTLAGCQRGGADLQCRAFKALLVRPVIPMQGSLDAFEQDVLAQWLLDKVEGPSLHRCDRQRN